ncbi:biotin/lipoyl-binding protein [Nostoc sp.]|uniref:biotin/lipoyl-binding protein n=1 Tax=Nostoc sp. TaxID=1180 RepID=UPI002FF8E15E
MTVKGQAVVRPSGELQIVQAATEGRVMQIHVKENQVVKAGDAIAIIDDSRLQTKKSQLQTTIEEAKLRRERIKAQIQSLDNQIRAETDKIKRIINAAEAALSASQRQYQDKKITAVAEFQEAQANLHSARAALNAAKLKQKRYESVAQGLSRDKLEEVQLATKQQEQAVAAAIAKKQRAEAALNPSHAEVEIATEQIGREKYAGESNKAAL